MTKFWCLFVTGQNRPDAPTKQHATREIAEAEAERLAKGTIHPVVVLEAVAFVQQAVPPMVWGRDFTEDEGKGD